MSYGNDPTENLKNTEKKQITMHEILTRQISNEFVSESAGLSMNDLVGMVASRQLSWWDPVLEVVYYMSV